MERNGILCAGAWCVDRNMTIDHWPVEETVSTVLAEKLHGGCPGHNMSTALKRLGALFPIEGLGLLGDDEGGRLLLSKCDALGIERSMLEVRPGITTALTLVMTAKPTGRRTFFYYPGAHALQTPDDFNFEGTRKRILHLGLPGLHAKVDAPWNDDASGWVTILKKAKEAGLKANIELASISPERLQRAVDPILPLLDILVINDFEAGALARIETVKDGVADSTACRRAAERLMATTNLSLVAVHFPMGGVVMTRGGAVVEHPSVNVPPSAIVGSNGAGDCFAAGILFGHHDGWPLEQSLKVAHASAAASLRSETTTDAVLPWGDCLKLADKWGWRAG